MSQDKDTFLAKDRIGPSFALSSIIENKFTQQYYSGSYGLINELNPLLMFLMRTF
jgi:hypothetical protein